MRYTVVLEPITDSPEFEPGWFYAHIPTFDLTTHGKGIEGATAAAQDLLAGWIATLLERGETVPAEANLMVTQLEIDPGAIQAA